MVNLQCSGKGPPRILSVLADVGQMERHMPKGMRWLMGHWHLCWQHAFGSIPVIFCLHQFLVVEILHLKVDSGQLVITANLCQRSS